MSVTCSISKPGREKGIWDKITTLKQNLKKQVSSSLRTRAAIVEHGRCGRADFVEPPEVGAEDNGNVST
jgi:hypothetical protein